MYEEAWDAEEWNGLLKSVWRPERLEIKESALTIEVSND